MNEFLSEFIELGFLKWKLFIGFIRYVLFVVFVLMCDLLMCVNIGVYLIWELVLEDNVFVFLF